MRLPYALAVILPPFSELNLTDLSFRIDPQILQRFPDIKVAALTAGIANPASLSRVVDTLLGQLPAAIEQLNTVEPITQMDEIAVWRQTYGAMSIKPSKFHSSIEALLRRVKKGDDISIGLPVVDIYNLISVIHGTPMGAYDIEKLGGSEGQIDLRLARPETDLFDPLGGRADSYPLNEDLVVYAMGADILCWGFNTRDSVKSSVDENSRSIIFMSETTSALTANRPSDALSNLANHLSEAGMEVGEVMVADASSSVLEL